TMWRAATIRSAVSTYFNKKEKKEKEDTAMHTKVLVEPIESRSNLKIGEKEIERHKPNDPFAIELDRNVEEKVYQINDKRPVANTEQFKRDITDDVSKKVLEQVSTDAKPFRDEILSSISDLVSSVRDEFTNIEKEISSIRMQGIPAYEPVVKYDDIKLKESTIDAIQENMEEKELKEESDYIDNLIGNEKEYTSGLSGLRVYHKLVKLAKEAKNGVQLRLFYENDRLSYDKKPVGRFGINPKNLIAGIAIGISIGLAIGMICIALLAVPPPT
ncbi:unnamed protein product, partial [marine sediment metagenome]